MFDDAFAISSVNSSIYTVPSHTKYLLVIVNSLLYRPSTPTDSMQISLIYANNARTCRMEIWAWKCLHIFNPHQHCTQTTEPNSLFSGVLWRCLVFLVFTDLCELTIAHIYLLKTDWWFGAKVLHICIHKISSYHIQFYGEEKITCPPPTDF